MITHAAFDSVLCHLVVMYAGLGVISKGDRGSEVNVKCFSDCFAQIGEDGPILIRTGNEFLTSGYPKSAIRAIVTVPGNIAILTSESCSWALKTVREWSRILTRHLGADPHWA